MAFLRAEQRAQGGAVCAGASGDEKVATTDCIDERRVFSAVR